MLLLLCAGIGRAQATAPSPASNKDLATVYVYRLDDGIVAFWFLSKTLPVYLGERANTRDEQKKIKIAMLKNKRYFMVRLPPGKYTFDTRLMRGHLDLEIAAGGEYYLRLDRGNDCLDEDSNYTSIPNPCVDANPSVMSVPSERWRAEKLKLKPIKAGDVKERKLVIIPSG
jgi:hypothetical protein